MDNAISTLAELGPLLARRGAGEAVVAFAGEGVQRWTAAHLAEASAAVAHNIQARGLGRASAVALFADPRPEWIAAALGVVQSGAVLVPLDVQAGAQALAHMLRDSGAALVYTDAAHADRLPTDRHALWLDATPGTPNAWLDAWRAIKPSPPTHKPDEIAAILYTSGTTGPPKGVPLSHGNLAFQVNTIARSGLVQADERVLLPLPLHHVYPFAIGLLVPLAMGRPIILPAALTGPQIARALKEGQASLIIGVPRLYQAMLESLEGRVARAGRVALAGYRGAMGLSSLLRRRLGWSVGRWLLAPLHARLAPQLRIAACGGAPLSSELAFRLEAFGWHLAVGYGLTETSPLLTLDLPPIHVGTVGQPVPGVELRVGEGGEVQARGAGVFRGYLNLPVQTAEAFTADGWFRTGDLGEIDAEGLLHLTGRLSEVIVTSGGVNIQPEEVEAIFAASALIREAALRKQDEGLALLVVPDAAEAARRGRDVEAAVRAEIAAISRTLPSYQRVAQWAITHEPLPRTRLGKLRRHLLAERYASALRADVVAGPMAPEAWPEQDRALLDGAAAHAAWEWLVARYPTRRLTPETHLALELQIDSMGWIDLTLALSDRTGAELDDAAIARIITVRDLLTEVAGVEARGVGGTWLDTPERVLDNRSRRYLARLPAPLAALARVLTRFDRFVMRRYFHVQAAGLDQLPASGPLVLAPNHGSLLDPFALAAVLRGRPDLFWGGFTGVAFRNPIVRGFSRLARVLPVDPAKGALSSLALASAVLARGGALVWFPEGQRSLDGRLQRFKRGIGLVLDHRPVPVIPVVIQGAHDALPPGRHWPHRTDIRVRFGAPLTVDELARRGQGERRDERIADGLYRRLLSECRAGA